MRKIKRKILFMQSNRNQLQWKFCGKISSGIDSNLYRRDETIRNPSKMKWKKMNNTKKKNRRTYVCCAAGRCRCVRTFFHTRCMTTRASDGIFKTAITSTGCRCERPRKILQHSTWFECRCLASSSIVDDRMRASNISCTCVHMKSLNANLIGFLLHRLKLTWICATRSRQSFSSTKSVLDNEFRVFGVSYGNSHDWWRPMNNNKNNQMGNGF